MRLDRNWPEPELTVQDGLLTLDCDVTDPVSVDMAAREAERRFRDWDILVNNAGTQAPGALDDLPLLEWNRLLAVNLTGYLICSQAFGRRLRARGRGAVVHVGSISGANPQPTSGAYSVTKAGVAMMSRQLAIEWGPYGVRSNVVCPGMVRTPLSEVFYQTPGVLERRRSVVPLRRIGAPEDISDAVLFLASDRAGYITGAEIVVDGGFTRTIMGSIPRPGFDQPHDVEAPA